MRIETRAEVTRQSPAGASQTPREGGGRRDADIFGAQRPGRPAASIHDDVPRRRGGLAHRLSIRCGVGAVVLCFAALAAPAAVLTEQDCRAHRDVLLDALARNREERVRHVEEALRSSPSEEDREQLEYERVQAWDYEERMRQLADQTWRDCMAHVRPTGDAK